MSQFRIPELSSTQHEFVRDHYDVLQERAWYKLLELLELVDSTLAQTIRTQWDALPAPEKQKDVFLSEFWRIGNNAKSREANEQLFALERSGAVPSVAVVYWIVAKELLEEQNIQ